MVCALTRSVVGPAPCESPAAPQTCPLMGARAAPEADILRRDSGCAS